METEIACSLKARMRGLLGRERFDGVLLLVPCNDIHTFGMHRAIDVAFVSAGGTVLESYRAVGARRRIRCRRAVATLERFASESPWFERGEKVVLKNCVNEDRRSDL